MTYLSMLLGLIMRASQNPNVRAAVSNIAAYAIRQGTAAMVRGIRNGTTKPRSQFTVR